MNFSQDSEVLSLTNKGNVEKLNYLIGRLQESISDLDRIDFQKKKEIQLADVSKIDQGNNSESLL